MKRDADMTYETIGGVIVSEVQMLIYPNDYIDKIICGDCIDVMRRMPDGCVDLVLTDPPFFMPAVHYQSRAKWQKHYGDLSPLKVFWNVVVSEMARLLKGSGHLFVFCNGDSYPIFYEPTYNRFDKLKSLVWDKERVGLGRIFRGQHELIIWGRWSEHFYKEDGKLRGDVLSYAPTSFKKRQHPVEKPTALLAALLAALIEPVTEEGHLVLDPFMGSGTTLLAAAALERRFIGIDISEEYCEIARERIHIEQSQLSLP